MQQKKCKDVMSNPVHTCSENDTAEQVAKVMEKHDIGFVPIVNACKEVVGVVTDRDLTTRILAKHQPPSTRIGDIMTRGDLATVQADADFRDAEEVMEQTHRSRVLVTDERNQPRGVIGLAEISRHNEARRAGEVLGSVKTGFAGARR
ncbi:MAG: CBS domain-containing protein [Planctomycetes bacterium]|nr:CBS domain-containing protein [Planctomycetota bacterium]NUQ33886.1 CBS domain-containing protein [Planctomycetaceae bacterium]